MSESPNGNILQPKQLGSKPIEADTQNSPIDSFSNDEIALIPIKQYFDLDANDTTQDKYVRSILAWAKSKGLSSRSDLNTELRKLELRMGAPELGERRTVRLSRYIELDRRLSDTIKEMDTYRRA